MSMHQIILTGKKCGLYGQEGFGILSCDRGFSNVKDALTVSNAYRAPEIDDGDGELSACVPSSYTYRPLSSDVLSVSLCACLKNSPYVQGRNHLCHMITFDCGGAEFYPCDYIGSESFVTEPDRTEVDSAEGLEYLDSPQLIPGKAATLNRAMKFLAQEGNFDIFKNMLCALLSRDTTKKRLIICDEYDSAVLWIAALNYALPVETAKKISFTTYAYNPDDADVDICCVIPKCTAYSENFDGGDKYQVFDILRGKYPTFDLSSAAYSRYNDFLLHAMTRDYGELVDFFTFLHENTSISEPTTDIASAYLMYYALNTEITAVTSDEFRQIMTFTVNYAAYSAKLRLTEKLLAVSSAVLRFDVPYMILTLKYMSGVYKDASLRIRDSLRAMLIDAVPVTAISRGMTSGAFAESYKELTIVADICKIDLVDELMANANNRSLKIIVTYQPTLWKNEFVLQLISSYVAKHSMTSDALLPAEPVGAFLRDVIKSAYDDKFGADSARYILNAFSGDEKLFIECEQTIECALEDKPDKTELISAVREDFYRIAAASLYDKRGAMFDLLASEEKYGRMWGVINEMLGTVDSKKLHSLFSEHYEKYLSVCEEYSKQHLTDFLEKYLATAAAAKGDLLKTAQEKVFEILLDEAVIIPSSGAVVSDMIARLTLNAPSKDGAKLINNLAGYERDIRKNNIGGKLQCLTFGLSALDIRNRKDYTDMKTVFDERTQNGSIDLTPYSDAEVEKYLSWVLPPFVENIPPQECAYVYGLFRLPSRGSVIFAEDFAEEYLRQGKNESSYKDFCVFLSFLYTKCGAEETQAVADMVSRLNSKRLEQLKVDAEEAFAGDYTLSERFSSMLSMEPSKKSFFSKLFKK